MTPLLLVFLWLAQAQSYRPLSLGDLIDAVGSNPDGLDAVELGPLVADHALFTANQAIGVAARLRDDPEGPVFIGWRQLGELWTYRWVDDDALGGVRAPADPALRLGRVEGLRSLGRLIVLETRSSSGVASVLMTADLTPVAHLAGSARASIGDGPVVVVRSGGGQSDVALLAPATRELRTIYTARGATITSVVADEQSDTLTFTVTPIASTVPIGAARGPELRIVCRSVSQSRSKCEPGGARLGRTPPFMLAVFQGFRTRAFRQGRAPCRSPSPSRARRAAPALAC
jgi:hypothetical protein